MTTSPPSGSETGELLPCPFCGSNAFGKRYYNGETTLFKVECQKCTANISGFDQSFADALKAWNTRAQPQAGEADLEIIERFVRQSVGGQQAFDAVHRIRSMLARPTPSETEGDQVQARPNYDMRELAKYLYAHCALDPYQAGTVAHMMLSDYYIRPLRGTQPEPSVCDQARGETRELLERADEYLSTIQNKGNCGPHHLVSDLAALLRARPTPSETEGDQVQADLVLVPRKPTQKMIEAGCENNPTQFNDGTPDGFSADVANDVYVAMVRAGGSQPEPSVCDQTREALQLAVHIIDAAAQHRAISIAAADWLRRYHALATPPTGSSPIKQEGRE